MSENNKILVIGGSGFIGRNLIELLIDKKCKFTVLDIRKPDFLPPDVKFIEGSFNSEQNVQIALNGCKTVIHLASSTLPQNSNEDPFFDVESNLLGSIRLLDLSVKNKINKFIFASSGGTVYGKHKQFPVDETFSTYPTCSYGIVKLALEKYLKLYNELYGIKTCSLRFANPYGKYQRTDRPHGAISVFCSKALKNEQIEIWGDGSVSRDFIYIDDLVKSIYQAIITDFENIEVNIGSGVSITLNELLSTIENLLNKRIKKKFKSGRDFDIPKTYLNIQKSKELLRWEPETDIVSGIRKTLYWIQDNIDYDKK